MSAELAKIKSFLPQSVLAQLNRQSDDADGVLSSAHLLVASDKLKDGLADDEVIGLCRTLVRLTRRGKI